MFAPPSHWNVSILRLLSVFWLLSSLETARVLASSLWSNAVAQSQPFPDLQDFKCCWHFDRYISVLSLLPVLSVVIVSRVQVSISLLLCSLPGTFSHSHSFPCFPSLFCFLWFTLSCTRQFPQEHPLALQILHALKWTLSSHVFVRGKESWPCGMYQTAFIITCYYLPPSHAKGLGILNFYLRCKGLTTVSLIQMIFKTWVTPLQLLIQTSEL